MMTGVLSSSQEHRAEDDMDGAALPTCCIPPIESILHHIDHCGGGKKARFGGCYCRSMAKDAGIAVE